MSYITFLPKLPNFKLGKREGKSDKVQMRDILQNFPAHFKNVKV